MLNQVGCQAQRRWRPLRSHWRNGPCRLDRPGRRTPPIAQENFFGALRLVVGRAKTRRHLHLAAHAGWPHLVEIEHSGAVRDPADLSCGGGRVVAAQGRGAAAGSGCRNSRPAHRTVPLAGTATSPCGAQLGDFNGSHPSNQTARESHGKEVCRDMEASRSRDER